jgi:hypothetical protein
MNQSLYSPMGALDPYGMQGGEFQQNPEQLLTDNYGPPQAVSAVNDPTMMNPKYSAYGAALMNIGDIIGGRAPSQNIGGAYMAAKQSNDSLRMNAAAMKRQGEQDELNTRYRESQIAKNRSDTQLKSSGGFQGTGMEAQALNSYLSQFPPEQRGRIKNDLVQQRLSRSITTVTPEGTFTQPGYDVSGYQPTPAQSVNAPVVEPPAFTPKPLTGEQAKASGFYDRMISSQGELDALAAESPNFDPSSTGETVSGAMPLVGNMLISSEKQRYNQAAKDWIRAKLRRESGAVIGEEEAAEEYRTYFPVPGDGEEVIAQKARARKTAEKAMRSASGNRQADQSKPKMRRYNPETVLIE